MKSAISPKNVYEDNIHQVLAGVFSTYLLYLMHWSLN